MSVIFINQVSRLGLFVFLSFCLIVILDHFRSSSVDSDQSWDYLVQSELYVGLDGMGRMDGYHRS